MVLVEFLGPIGKEPLRVDIKNFDELKEVLPEELNSWLDICAVALNDTIISSLDTPLKDGDKISLLPPVCGG